MQCAGGSSSSEGRNGEGRGGGRAHDQPGEAELDADRLMKEDERNWFEPLDVNAMEAVAAEDTEEGYRRESPRCPLCCS